MLAEIIHSIFSMENVEENKPFYPRPSLAGPQRCTRQMVYWASGANKTQSISGRALQVFSDSGWTEETTADVIRKSAFHLHSEQMGITIKNAFPWMPEGTWECKVCGEHIPYTACHGHIDYIVSDILGVDRICDHKGINHFSWESYYKGAVPYDYFVQLAIYARGLQQDNPELKEILLLMKNKNTSGYLEFRGVYDNKTDTLKVFEKTTHLGERIDVDIVMANITNDAFNKFGEVYKHKFAGTLPERQYEYDTWICGYCSHKALCWSGWANEHKELASDVELEGEIVDLLKYKSELTLHLSEMKKEEIEIKDKIKGILKESGVRSGKAGDYIIDWKVGSRKKLDEELLPPGAYHRALIEVPTERLNIRKVRAKDEEVYTDKR